MTLNRPQTDNYTTQYESIHSATRLGHVHYTTAHLDRQIAFYRDILGFKLHWREDDSAGLGAGGENMPGNDDLLRLTESKTARRARHTTGLYHTAFLVPTRWDLAQLLKSIAETRTPIQGMSDHGTHHAIYLPDAEGNGIELAWDFPPEQWPKSFREMMERNRGLRPETVFSALADGDATWDGLNPGTKVGHVHLHVSELGPTDHFYREILGFDIPFDMADAPPEFAESAIFFSAGGYHHHIGTNVWQGVGAPPPPAAAIGLRHFTVVLPNEAALQRVLDRVKSEEVSVEQTENGVLIHDPSQNGVLLTTEKV
jgi:catechol 2,3-dioxygenase